MAELLPPSSGRSRGHSEHNIGFDTPEHPLRGFLVEEFPSLRKTQASIITGLSVAMGEGKWRHGWVCTVSVQTETTFPDQPPPFQTRLPTQKTHVPVQNQGQRQGLRGKQRLSQASFPYLVCILPAPCWFTAWRSRPSMLSFPAPTSWGSDTSVVLKILSSSPAEISCYLICTRLLYKLVFHTLPVLVENDCVLWTEVLNRQKRLRWWGRQEEVDRSVLETAPNQEVREAGPRWQLISRLKCQSVYPSFSLDHNCWCSYTEMKYLATVIK